ncbi:putative secologanin synthase [Helianthus annuus]|uniref:Cytochrome P450 n=2 Tax=Helianthus annuus TaxID=4232 RepID=F8S1H1_HELAN|nr:cytochrome P450 CYP72A219 [Helianthus annuus]AEI59771.1 cytochrome P450 [Helianthus annuus]KAF5777977.1 putative secologanin synthase [Helianthus annuus]KAJ0505326.1 putative secologanin synthase [Helianthus annuus]KAJ0675003.1 putative secologanin synthase [Helianthus annuus]KAJ0862743.1 putative secologanin synthase [Helianthus annuus]
MEVSGVIVIILALSAFGLFNWLWLKPKRMEKFLRKQGLKGSSYRFFSGDLQEIVKLAVEAKSKPIKLNDDILPRVLPYEHKAVTAYGKNFFTWMGPTPIVHFSEPALVKEILSNVYQFHKPSGGNPLRKLLETGLVNKDADQWTKHRKIMNPAFHVEKLKHMVPAFYTCTAEMINKWEDMLKTQSSCELNIVPYFKRLTCDVISRTAFGSSFEEGQRIFELLIEQVDLLVKTRQSIYIPGTSWLPTKRNNRMREIDRELKTLIRSHIDNRIIAMERGEGMKDDLLGILLDSNFKAIKEQGNNNSGLTIDEIIEECKFLYVGGHETTLNFLVWSMVLLAQHTDWQDKARDEVSQFIGDNIPDKDALNRLKILGMFINEVLRLYPPAPMTQRMIHQETKLGDITLPAGSMLHLHIMLLHHDRDVWGDDVKEFKPERFSDGVSKVTKGQASYVPFGVGPRICIAQNSTLMEAKLVLAMILKRYRLELSPSYTHAPHVYVTLEAQHGAHLILHKL